MPQLGKLIFIFGDNQTSQYSKNTVEPHFCYEDFTRKDSAFLYTRKDQESKAHTRKDHDFFVLRRPSFFCARKILFNQNRVCAVMNPARIYLFYRILLFR